VPPFIRQRFETNPNIEIRNPQILIPNAFSYYYFHIQISSVIWPEMSACCDPAAITEIILRHQII